MTVKTESCVDWEKAVTTLKWTCWSIAESEFGVNQGSFVPSSEPMFAFACSRVRARLKTGNPKTLALTLRSLTLTLNPNPILNQARAMFRLTEQVVSNTSCTAVNSLRTPLSPLSCSPHCWPLGASDQVVTDLVTSASLELLLLAVEDM